MDEEPADRTEITFDFALPHGTDLQETDHDHSSRVRANDDSSITDYLPGNQINIATEYYKQDPMSFGEYNISELDYRQFSPGFSDDDGNGEPFERAWLSRQTNKQSSNPQKSRKSPRQTETDNAEPDKRTKKSRRSLRSESEEQGNEEQVRNCFASAIAGHGIGAGISSLNLEQQQVGDDVIEAAAHTGFGVAYSDTGSVRDSPVPSDEELIVPPDTVPYYELRQNIDRNKAVTHVDNDTSGNWHPTQEAKERTAKSTRATAAKKSRNERAKRKNKTKAHRDFTMKCIVRLPFYAFGNVRNITNDEDNWPNDWSEIDSEQERELEEYRATYRANTPDCILQLPLEDPAGRVDDLTGHPAARGCRSCRKLEQSCSMVDGGTYPCNKCVEDGDECQLIQEPTLKGGCKQCAQAGGATCSFENKPTQLICDQCAENGYICEALPPYGYKTARISLDKLAAAPDRPLISCTSCRNSRKRCSLKSKRNKLPCARCKKESFTCRFVDPPESDSEDPAAEVFPSAGRAAPDVAKPNLCFFTEEDIQNMDRRGPEKAEVRQSTPELEMEDVDGNKGVLIELTTSFAHPVKFSIQKTSLSDCNFCENPLFGVVGHFEKKVHVIRWHSGQGYAEVGGGHCQNEGETTMCSDCTNRRLQILVCSEHKLEPIPGAVTDHSALADELTAAEVGGRDMWYQLSRWCSMCFMPAAFGCSTPQPDLCGEEDEIIAGCHLRLCHGCEAALRERYKGNFDAMATDLASQPKISEADGALGRSFEGRPRADVGFLMQDGLLIHAMQMED